MTHKTELAFALNSHPKVFGADPPKYEYRFPFFSADWCGWYAHAGNIGFFNCRPEHLEHARDLIAAYLHVIRCMPYNCFLIDRFHLTLWTNLYLKSGLDIDLSWEEQELKSLDFRLILCMREPDSFSNALVERLKISLYPGAYSTPDYYAYEQLTMVDKAKRSRLPVLFLDVTSGNIPELAEQIVQWLEHTKAIGFDENIS